MHEKRSPYLFDEFFASGKEESVSPFLTKKSRKWSHNLSLKISIVSGFFLLLAFISHFSFESFTPIFLLLVYALSGTPALINAIEDCINLEINIDVLMTLAALLSILIGSGLEGALLLVLFELSAAMELSVTQKTKSILAGLHRLSPATAYQVKEDGHLIERSVKEIPIGAKILIKAGEISPLDGKVVDGSSFITLSHITGESIPIAKTIGDEVLAGARNLDGTLTLCVTKSNLDSTLSKIIGLITHAQESKPKLQKWIDAIDKKYATTIIFLTVLFACLFPVFFPSIPYLGMEGSIYRALTFLIAASPCALVIGAPTAYLSAISCSAKKGILLKGGSILDALAQCQTVAFDKTGTLTTGQLICTHIEPLNEKAKDTPIKIVLSLAGSMERHVKHPIAEAITNLVKEKNISFALINNMQSIPGSGLTAFDQESGEPCYLGSKSFIFSKQSNLNLSSTTSLTSSTQTYFLFKEALFVFHFQDEVRKDAKDLITRLKTCLKMDIAMLTGDEEVNANMVASSLGIKTIFSHLKPEDKLDKVAFLSQHKGLIMVGDGVNDAPALARATVGVSMGKIGSSSAIAAADVIFLQDDITSLDWIIHKSHQTLRIIKQNISLAL
ncbi:MAG: heavy metal translocating P-type ATPase, partial [Verrucomicrobia bacterium]|nr:heavy metal translocating P-type ATPase [Verrucomicrobiota bacterium]